MTPEYWANLETQISAFKGGQGPNLWLDDGGDLTLLVHNGGAGPDASGPCLNDASGSPQQGTNSLFGNC